MSRDHAQKESVQTDTSSWFAILSAIPATALAIFYTYVIRARLVLGHWPTPYNPDPKSLGFSVHYLAALILMPATFASAIMALILVVLLATGRLGSFRAARKRILIFVIIWSVWFLLMRLDPGHFMYWFMD